MNQSMKIPEQSLFGSYASNRCHLYFCSHVQSRLHLGVFGLLHISWWIACSNSLLFRIARTFPLLLLAQYGVTISTLDWHTSSFPPFSPPAGLPGKSAWRLCLSEEVSFPTSNVPSRTSRRNLVSCLSVLTTLTVVTVLGSCSTPYILFSKALLSSINLSIASAG